MIAGQQIEMKLSLCSLWRDHKQYKPHKPNEQYELKQTLQIIMQIVCK